MMISLAHLASNLLSHSLSWVKMSFAGALSLIVEIFLFAFQAQASDTDKTHWYDHPAAVAAVVTGAFLILAKASDIFWEKYKLKKQREKEDGDQHTSFSIELKKMEHLDKDQLLSGFDRLHKKEMRFFVKQLIEMGVTAFRARQKQHVLTNELNAANSYFFILQGELAGKGLKLEPNTYKPKLADDLFPEIDARCDEERKRLEEQYGFDEFSEPD